MHIRRLLSSPYTAPPSLCLSSFAHYAGSSGPRGVIFYLMSRHMRPEGPWQRAEATTAGFYNADLLSPTDITRPSGALISYLSALIKGGEKVEGRDHAAGDRIRAG